MNHNEFFKLLRDKAAYGAYVLAGTEDFIKNAAVNAAISCIDEVSRDMNVTRFDSCGADALIAACETLPFFSESRLVIVDTLPKDSDAQKFLAYYGRIPKSTLLLFVSRDKNDSRTSVYQKLKAVKRLAEFLPLSESAAVQWVFQHASDYECTITQQTAAFFVSIVGTDCAALNNELAKAAGYSGYNVEITKSIISASVTRNIEYSLYSITDYFLSNKTADGLRTYKALLADGTDAYLVLRTVSNRLRDIIQTYVYINVNKNVSKENAIKALGLGKQGYFIYPKAASLDKACFDAAKRCYKRLLDVMYTVTTAGGSVEMLIEQALMEFI